MHAGRLYLPTRNVVGRDLSKARVFSLIFFLADREWPEQWASDTHTCRCGGRRKVQTYTCGHAHTHFGAWRSLLIERLSNMCSKNRFTSTFNLNPFTKINNGAPRSAHSRSLSRKSTRNNSLCNDWPLVVISWRAAIRFRSVYLRTVCARIVVRSGREVCISQIIRRKRNNESNDCFWTQ